MPEYPNILFCHDLGQYLGCYGHDIETPRLDRLAERGVRFEKYFCTAPQYAPSRASILTGKYPHNNGVMGLTNPDDMLWGQWELNEGEYPLPSRLRDIGYETHLFGLQHEHASACKLYNYG
jgi:arylsulfatase A-like enzyme